MRGEVLDCLVAACLGAREDVPERGGGGRWEGGRCMTKRGKEGVPQGGQKDGGVLHWHQLSPGWRAG